MHTRELTHGEIRNGHCVKGIHILHYYQRAADSPHYRSIWHMRVSIWPIRKAGSWGFWLEVGGNQLPTSVMNIRKNETILFTIFLSGRTLCTDLS